MKIKRANPACKATFERMKDSISIVVRSIKDDSVLVHSALVHTRRYGAVLGNGHLLRNVSNLLHGVRKSRYQKYRVICTTLQQRAAARE